MQSHSDQLYGAMQTAAANGANRNGIIVALIRAALHFVPTIGIDGAINAALAAYDRFCQGDSPMLPGDGNDPNSAEAILEKMGHDAIPLLIRWGISLALGS